MKVEKTENSAVDDALVNVWTPHDLDLLCSKTPMKDESADHFLRAAYRDGMLIPYADPFAQVDPFEMTLEGREVPDPRAFQTLERMHITKRNEYQIDLDMISDTPEAIEYVENAHTGLVANFNYLPYELARFVVPENRVGIVRTLETDLSWDDPNIQWPRGDALFHERQDVDVRWYLKVESFDTKNPVDPYTYRGPLVPPEVEIPGTPFGPLPSWREMRFLWGSYCPVFFILPPNTLLSLWIVFHDGSCNAPLRSASGRFTGMLQAQSSMRAYRNVTTGW